MLKKIIFDLDNTLIEWKDEDWNTIVPAALALNISLNQTEVTKIISSVRNFVEEGFIFNKENMINHINKQTNLNLPGKFIDKWLVELGKCVPEKIPFETSDTLYYLSKKYELVIISNWFVKTQIERLDRTNLLQYFRKVYGIDNIEPKPAFKVFEIAIANDKPNECLVVGDEMTIDIIPALKLGMSAIFYNYNKEPITKKEVTTITTFEELKKIL